MRPADEYGLTVHFASDAQPGAAFEAGDGGQRSEAIPGACCDGLRYRMFRGVLQRTGEPEHLVGVLAGSRDDVRQSHGTGGDRSRLVEDDGVDPPGRLQDLRAADENAQLGSATGTHQQRGRRRQSERARAGHDQDRHGGGQRAGDVEAVAEPEPEGGHGHRNHDGDEHRGHPVGQSLDGGLAGLRLGDQPGYLRELGVGTDSVRPDDQPSAGVHGRAHDRVLRSDLDRHALTGQHGGVHGRGAFDDDSVGGDLLARPDDEEFSDRELLDRHADLATVPEHRDILGAELQQGTQRRSCLTLGSVLGVTPREDEDGEAGGDLEVDVMQPFTC